MLVTGDTPGEIVANRRSCRGAMYAEKRDQRSNVAPPPLFCAQSSPQDAIALYTLSGV